ncbi:MAG: hypothetical protein PHV30_09625 [Candidatus Margulisbacteria bacterium]|nr:hypothetical protein [Candidatus Margulisiibacteriota bacterium]
MRIRIFFLILVLISFSILRADEEKFVLPDVFVTAKDSNKLDMDLRLTTNPRIEWQNKPYMKNMAGLQDRGYKLGLDNLLNRETTGNIYNEIKVGFGLPSYLMFGIKHAYTWDNYPYYVSLDKTAGEKLYVADAKSSSMLFAALGVDDNIYNLKWYENNLRDAGLSSLQFGLKTFWNIPITYYGKMFNANAYAGNPAVSYFYNSGIFDVGQIEFLNEKYPSIIRATLLNSKNNNYIDLRLNTAREYSFFDTPQNMRMGLNIWSNTGISGFSFLVDDSWEVQLTRDVALSGEIELNSLLPDMDQVFQFDYAEINDSVLEPDQRMGMSVTLNNYWGLKENMFFNLYSYGTLKVWDDLDADGYYAQEKIRNVQVFKAGSLFQDLKIGEEKIDVLLQVPFYSQDLPNQFDKFAEINYKKDIWNGQISVAGAYYLRELGRSPGVFKNSYFDVSCAYDSQLSKDFWWGLSIGHLFSGGAENLSGHPLSDPFVYIRFRMIL